MKIQKRSRFGCMIVAFASLLFLSATSASAQPAPAGCPAWIVTMFSLFQAPPGAAPAPKMPSSAQCDPKRYTAGAWRTSDVSVYITDLINRAQRSPAQFAPIVSQLMSAPNGATPAPVTPPVAVTPPATVAPPATVTSPATVTPPSAVAPRAVTPPPRAMPSAVTAPRAVTPPPGGLPSAVAAPRAVALPTGAMPSTVAAQDPKLVQCLADFQKGHQELDAMYREGVRKRMIDASKSRQMHQIETRMRKTQDDIGKPGTTLAQCNDALKSVADERTEVLEFLRTPAGARER